MYVKCYHITQIPTGYCLNSSSINVPLLINSTQNSTALLFYTPGSRKFSIPLPRYIHTCITCASIWLIHCLLFYMPRSRKYSVLPPRLDSYMYYMYKRVGYSNSTQNSTGYYCKCRSCLLANLKQESSENCLTYVLHKHYYV